MRTPATLLLCLLLAAPAAAQSPRTSTLVANPAGDAYGPAVACDADLAAMVWFDSAPGIFAVQCSTSDGRGETWGPPVAVDDGTAAFAWKTLFDTSVAVAAGNVYVAWTDPRQAMATGDRDVWFQRSLSGGAGFQPVDTWVDKGLPPGLCDVKELRMGVDGMNPTNPNDDLIAILMLVENDFTLLGDEELYLNYSTDSGANWLPLAIPFSAHTGLADVDFMDLAVDGGRVYGVWHDDFFTRLDDNCFSSCYDPAMGGFAWLDLQMDAPAPGIDVDDEVAIDARGPQVAVLYMEVLTVLPGGHRLMGRTSNDGGLTWTAPAIVGTYTPFVDDCDYPDVAIAANGNVIAAWLDDRMGPKEVCSAVAPGWSLVDTQVSFAADARPIQLICPDDMAVIVWEAPPVPPHFVEAAMSPDSGLSWYQPVGLSMNLGDIDDPAVAWDPAHGNFVAAWKADDLGLNDPYAGGFRPQTLVPVGNFFLAGSPVSFQVQDWPRRDRGLKFGVVASNSTGVLRIADGRDLGIVHDALFQRCRTLIPGILSGTIGANGAGSTPTFNLPAFGGTIYAVGVAYTTATNIGYFTDIVPLP